MSESKKVNRSAFSAILLSYLFLAVGWAVIGLLVFKDADTSSTGFFVRSEFFTIRLIWAEVLIALFFFGGLLLPYNKFFENRKHIGAGYLIIAHRVTMAMTISLIILVLSAFIPTESYEGTCFRLHIALQIVIVIIAVIAIASTYFSMAAQLDGIEEFPANVKKPSDLCLMLQNAESNTNLAIDQVKIVKKIRESIKYSIPENGTVTAFAEYHELAETVEKINSGIAGNDLTELEKHSSAIEILINTIVQKTKK